MSFYNSFKGRLDGSIDWENDTIKAMLMTDTYSQNIDTDVFKDDVSGEATGTGYSAGGVELTGASITIDTSSDLAKYDANDASWLASTITAYGVVLYKDTGTPSTSPLVAYISFGENKSSVDDEFKLQWSANGIFTLA